MFLGSDVSLFAEAQLMWSDYINLKYLKWFKGREYRPWTQKSGSIPLADYFWNMESNWELSEFSFLTVYNFFLKKLWFYFYKQWNISKWYRSGRRVMNLEQLIWYTFFNSLAFIGLMTYAQRTLLLMVRCLSRLLKEFSSSFFPLISF